VIASPVRWTGPLTHVVRLDALARMADAPRSRLDPDHVPSPVAVKAADQAQYDKTQFRTNLVGELPPLATTDFVAVDEGPPRQADTAQRPMAAPPADARPRNVRRMRIASAGIANPKFIRMTMYNLPHADDVARHAVVPMGAVIQPYASLSPNEVRSWTPQPGPTWRRTTADAVLDPCGWAIAHRRRWSWCRSTAGRCAATAARRT